MAVSYFVERDRYDPYEIVMVGEQHREEVSRITLRGRRDADKFPAPSAIRSG